jgi:hypothetical protein
MSPVNQFEMIAGTTPNEIEPHEPRTIRWKTQDGPTQMMSEIEGGIFVGWSHCSRCAFPIRHCDCDSGPVEPEHIARWRNNRYTLAPPKPTDLKPTAAETVEGTRHTQEDLNDVGF